MYNPWKREIKFVQAMNEGIRVHHAPFTIYRTVNGKVLTCALDMMSVDLTTGELRVTYTLNGEMITEKARELDLKLFSQFAKQMQAASK